MHSKVPDTEIDLLLADHLHQRVLTKGQRLLRSQLHPVTAGKNLLRRLDNVLLLVDIPQSRNLEARRNPRTLPNIGTNNHIPAIRRTAVWDILRRTAGAMSIHCHRCATRRRRSIVANPDIQSRSIDMELNRRPLALELNQLMRTRQRIHRCLQHIVRRIPIQFVC